MTDYKEFFDNLKTDEMPVMDKILKKIEDYIEVERVSDEEALDESNHISFSLKIKEFKDSLIKISSTKNDSDISETEVYSYINGDWVNILFNNSLYLKYTISLPQCEIDFINEGYELNHCVSTYYDIVCDREALVFFLRDSSKPEEPLYTIETDTRFTRIIQVSGKFNVDLNPYTDEPACLAIVDFCKRFFLDFSNLKYFDKFLDKK